MADYRKAVGTCISYNENVEARKKDGGTYQAFRLIYTNAEGEAITVTKPVQGLKFNHALANALKSLRQGDQFVINEEKNQAGFWEIKSIVKGTDDAEPMSIARPSNQTGQANKPAATATSTGRDFESKEERTVKQDYIIRQSSLERAIEVLGIGQKAPINPGSVIDLAEVFFNYVKTGKPASVEVGSIEDMEDDIPQ